MLLAQIRSQQAAEQHKQTQQAQQRELDEQHHRKNARRDFWKKCGYGIAAALFAPLFAFLGHKILDALLLVIPKMIEFFKYFFHDITSLFVK